MIRRAARLVLPALLLGGGAALVRAQENFQLQGRPPGLEAMRRMADPSEVVSAEIAFAQKARDDGQWTAFRKTADKDAIMFVPGVVNAQSWLRKRDDPAQAIWWSPDRVYMSCDGSYGFSHGHADYPGGRKGGFATIWRRQKDGSFQWVLDWSTARPDFAEGELGIEGKVADCAGRRSPGVAGIPEGGFVRPGERRGRERPKYEVVRIPDPPPASGSGQSLDGTLKWAWTTSPDGARSLKVTTVYDGEAVTLLDDKFAAGE